MPLSNLLLIVFVVSLFCLAVSARSAPSSLAPTCKIGVLREADLVSEFGFSERCDYAELGTWLSTSQYKNPKLIADHFARRNVSWRDADVIIVDTSCYGLKLVQLVDFPFDTTAKITWNWKQMDNIISKQTWALGPKLRAKVRNDVLFVGLASHPFYRTCLEPPSLPAPKRAVANHPPNILLRTDTFQSCPDGTKYIDMPYNVVPTREPILSLDDREHLASFAGACSHEMNQGKHARYLVQKSLGNRTNFAVHCYNKFNRNTALTKQQTTDMFRKSVYCLIPAGDTPSSHRVAETLVLGCIPVFIGPPFSFLPLPEAIPWKDISLTFYVKSLEALPKRDMDLEVMYRGRRPKPSDYDLHNGRFYSIENLEQVGAILESIPRRTLRNMIQKISMYREIITYNGVLFDMLEGIFCDSWHSAKTPY